MAMKPRHQRMIFIGVVAIGMIASAGFAYKALQENLLFYYSPSQVAAGEAPSDRPFRLGGLVVEGSLQQVSGTLTARFRVTDLKHEVAVEHTGVRPDLFKEGQGVVVRGVMQGNGHFLADADGILAKHDENYMAPEVQESLAEAGAESAR